MATSASGATPASSSAAVTRPVPEPSSTTAPGASASIPAASAAARAGLLGTTAPRAGRPAQPAEKEPELVAAAQAAGQFKNHVNS